MCAVNLPVFTYNQTSSSGTTRMPIQGNMNILPSGLILLLLPLKWRWRGVLWMLFGILGLLFAPFFANTLYAAARDLGQAAGMTYGPPAPSSGLFAISFGYLVILAGSLWDLREIMETRIVGR